MEKSSGNVFTRLAGFLRNIHFFEACVNIAWSFAIVSMSFFMDYEALNIDVPDAVAISCIAIIIVAGFILWVRLRRNEGISSAIWAYQIFYYIIPVIVNIVKLIFMDDLYSYGGFMPGFEALGNFIMCIALIVIAAIGCVIFNVVRLIKRKRADAGKETGSKALRVIVDILNVVSVLAIVILVLFLAIGWCVEGIKKEAYKAELSRNEKYRAEVLTSLIESDIYEKAVWKGVNEDGTIDRGRESDSNAVSSGIGSDKAADNDNTALFDEAENELCWEAYTYSLFVEALARNQDISAEDGTGVGISEITPEVYQEGARNYTEFTKTYVPERGVEMADQDIIYDSESKTVSVSSELYCVDEKDNSTVHACMVVVFDKEWKVVEIRCQEEPLKQYVP